MANGANDDQLDLGINIEAGDGADVADRLAESIGKLREELDKLYKTQNSADAKAAAAAAKEQQKQLADELRASAINIANTKKEQAAQDRAAAKQQLDELKASAINLRIQRQAAAAQERADLAAAAAARRADAAQQQAANRQLADEQKAAARNLAVLRAQARAQDRQAALDQKAAAKALAQIEKDQIAQEKARVAALAQVAAQRQQTMREEANSQKIIDGQRAAVAALVRELLLLASAYVGVRTIKNFIDEGFKFNETIETSRLGVAALITSQTKMTESNGRVIDGVEKLGVSQAFAAEQVDKLRVAGLRSTATTEQLVVAFQQAVGVGLRWGLTLDQIRVLTVQVAQAAGALGVPLNQLNEEIRSLLTGTITPRNTRIATALGITNAQIKQAQQAGNLFDFVSKRMEAFSVAGEATAKTFRGVMSNIKEALQNFAGDATKPLFESLRISGQTALEGMFDLNTAHISEKLRGILSLAQDIFGDVGDLVSEGLAGAVESAQEFSAWLEENTVRVHGLLDSIKEVSAEVGSLVKEIISLGVNLGEAGIQGGILENIFRGMGLVVADIHTFFDAILTALGGIGVAVIAALVLPITTFIRLAGRAAGIFNKELGESIENVGKVGQAWVEGLAQNLSDYSKNLEVGNTATERYGEKVTAMRAATEGAAVAQEKLRDSLNAATSYENRATQELDKQLAARTVSQKQYTARVHDIQLKAVNDQLHAQQLYLQSIDASNEGDRARTRVIINELIKRKNALNKNVTLSPIAGAPEPKDSAAKAAAGDTALIKAELANQLKDLKIALDNQKLSYHEYYAAVTKAQQDAFDKEIVVQKKLLSSTTDLGARQKVLDQIKILEANKLQVVEDNNEKERQDEIKLAQEVTTAHVQLLKDQGRLSDARALEIGDKYRKLIAQLKAEGDTAGADIVSRLFNIDDAKTKLDELMNRSKNIESTLSNQLGAINVEVASHAITEQQARQKIVVAYQDARAQLEAMLPAMRESAALTEDPNQINAVEALATKIAQMSLTIQQTADDWFKLKEAGREALVDGLGSFIDQALEGAKDLGSIWRSVANDIVSSLRKVASQMLATLIIQRTLGFFGGFGGGGGGGVTGGGVQVAAEAGVGVASGGYISGRGTTTSDSIPAWLSNGEFVVNAAAVKTVGTDFLHAINNSRSSTVMRRRTRGYAEGGLVSAGAGVSNGGFDATLALEPGLVVKHIRTRQGTEAVINILAENRNMIRRIIGS